MSEFNYEQDIEIDGHALDLEWMNQPKVFGKYSHALDDKRDELRRAEQYLDICKAELADDVRRNFSNYGFEKSPTVDAVKDTVTMCLRVDGKFSKFEKAKAYCNANEKVFVLQHEADTLATSVKAFDHRKKALENEVTLHGQQYFAGPSVPNDIGREYKRQARETERGESRDRTVGRGRSRRE